MSRCLAAGQRRERRDSPADDTIAETIPPTRRARTQAADEVIAEPSTATAAAASSMEAAGEKSVTSVSPNAHGMHSPPSFPYDIDTLFTRLPTPQDLPRWRASDRSSLGAPRCRT